jgi:hypothetical protein
VLSIPGSGSRGKSGRRVVGVGVGVLGLGIAGMIDFCRKHRLGTTNSLSVALPQIVVEHCS